MNERSTLPEKQRTRSWGALPFMLVFCTFWSGITLWFDSLLVTALVRQITAQTTYKCAAATITRSEVVTDRSSEGDTHGPAIAYRYTVDGREHTGSRYSYFEMKSGGKRARRIVDQYPPGHEATVYYDPDHPEVSSLTVGVDPLQLYMLIFLTPFNVIMLTMWWIGVRMVRPAQAKPLHGRLIFDDGFHAVVRVSSISPLAVGLVTLAICTFLLVFVLAFGFSIDPPMSAAAGSVALAVVASRWAAVRQARAISSGRYDLRVDRALKQITLPRQRGENAPRTIRFKDAGEVELRLIPGETPIYALELTANSDGPMLLETGLDQDTGLTLRDWLRRQISGASSHA